jgi:hypothetical protein
LVAFGGITLEQRIWMTAVGGGVLLATLVALGVLAYLYYERTRPVAKIEVPGVSGEITKEGVDIEVGKPKGFE